MNVVVHHNMWHFMILKISKVQGENVERGKKNEKTMVAADFHCMLFGYYCPMPACGRIG